LQAAAPLAAITWESFTPGSIAQGFKTFKDRVYYGDVLPPVGSQTISYARFLELLSPCPCSVCQLESSWGTSVHCAQECIFNCVQKACSSRYECGTRKCAAYCLWRAEVGRGYNGCEC